MMERILALACLCIFYVGIVKSDDYIVVPYYRMTENATDCSVVSKHGPNELNATVTNVGNTSTICPPLQNEHATESVAVCATVSYVLSLKCFNIEFNATVSNSSQSDTFQISSNSVTSKNYTKTDDIIESIYVRGSNFNSTYVCVDMVLLYKNQSNYNTLTSVGLACWTGSNITVTPHDQTANDTNGDTWARTIGKNLCSAAYSNMQLTPLFALAISFIVIFINKT